MRVTAFHVVRRIEEAALEYFSTAPLFQGREIVTSRLVDFRRGTAGIQFFLQDTDACVGGLEVDTVQEDEEKVAFQCRFVVKPSGVNGQHFLMNRVNREPDELCQKLLQSMVRAWEADSNEYATKALSQEPIAATAIAE